MREWLRPLELLLPGELERQDCLLELFEDVVRRISEDPSEPSALELLQARQVTACLWKIDREASDGAVLTRYVVGAPNYAEGRRAAFRETDDRQRLQALHAAGIPLALQLLRELRLASRGVVVSRVEGTVLPMPAKPKLIKKEGS